MQQSRLLRRALLRAVEAEQRKTGEARRMSGILWDMFSGSAPYRDILTRMLHPGFLCRLAWAVAASAGSEDHGRPVGVRS